MNKLNSIFKSGDLAVFTGLLDFVQNDDELAIILAHEMSHVNEIFFKIIKLRINFNLDSLFQIKGHFTTCCKFFIFFLTYVHKKLN